MAKEFNTIDDFDVENKTVLVRIDINAPVDPSSGIILDDTRLKLHAQTVKELSNKGAKVVLLAHQSRPGKKDFTTLSQHADALSEILNLRVKYIDSLFSNAVKKEIKALKPHEILLLENARFFSEETLSRTPLEQSKTHLVTQLTPLIDYFVNDAFAAAHRSQASLVGFTVNTPSAAGRVMEKELTVIQDALDNVEHPCVFLLGGMKPEDSIDVMENVLSNGTADSILTTGIVGNIVLWASGADIGEVNKEFIISKGYEDMVARSKKLIDEFGDKVKYPIDVACDIDGERKDFDSNEIPNESIFDIGVKTIALYAQEIRDAKYIFANGPAGVFEFEKFAKGTNGICTLISELKGATTIIGGGDSAAAAIKLGFEDKFSHISTGGGASLEYLEGKVLPGIACVNEK